MEFYKLEANGNDFIIILTSLDTKIDVNKLTNRNYGIGADGLIILDSNYHLKIFNSDGSSAKMCGNGMRCIGKLLNYLENKEEFKVYIDNQEITISKVNDNYQVLMPFPMMRKIDDGYFVNVSNNHLVILVNDLNESFNEQLKLKSQTLKCNIHLVKVINNKLIQMKTYEYGVQETLSCGSGAIASFFVLYMLNKVTNNIIVKQDGGQVNCFLSNGKYYLSGLANLVYKGDFYEL